MSNNLSDEFNVEEVREEIETFKDILSKIKEIPDPSKIVTAAIEKASTFVDLIHSEVVNGEMSPRYMETAAGLISTIIQSSGFLNLATQQQFDNDMKKVTSKQKDREIDVKEQELKIKELYYNKKQISTSGNGETNNNIIVTDYDSILKFLDGKKQNLIEG